MRGLSLNATGANMPIRKPKPNPKPKMHPDDRLKLLERIAKLTSELCDSVDAQEEDIGGHRNAMDILAELGPLCDTLEGR